MVRRKGERPVEPTWPDWDCGWHPVRRMIADGDPWLRAWHVQACTPINKLAKLSGLSGDRIWQLIRGDLPTDDEVRALAGAWRVDPAQVFASISLCAGDAQPR